MVLLIIVALSIIAVPFIDVDWLERMYTINDDTEVSAMGRVAVWLWVIEYIATHPWGGSFDMFLINSYSMMLQDGTELTVMGKAFHSIYFEMLGEGGVPGFLMYAALIALTLSAFMRHKKVVLATKEKWLGDAGRYLLIATLVFLAGGAFIGVAFQSYFYYLVALSAAYLNLEKQYARA
jgi:putative inorganic carbon (HCO3(-)) transporter